MKRIKTWITLQVYIKIYMPLLWLINFGLRDYKKITGHYGKFIFLSRKQISKDSLYFSSNDSNVTGQYLAEIALFLKQTKRNFTKVLLDGDSNDIKKSLKKINSLSKSTIITTGIKGNFDIKWNFENDPPALLKNQLFDLIISQSNFEHLIDPYKHFQQLSSLLTGGGIFILATHLPGYPYHRYPIDALRFMPDWFEQVAKKNKLKVVHKYLRIEMIVVYIFQKL